MYTYTSTTGRESQEYMDDSTNHEPRTTNHEIWNRSTLATKFSMVSEFLTAAAPNDVARFDDTSSAYTLERD
ncbi:hypothetical protein [Mycobacteroides abscessus]|uniref:hypothetical protein n=1 Tax=Mycobacteroides abscessus TaxID=36809 RepID=UPI00092766F9|nr:hypothetical protein [Mycobacteroides abscessus]SIL20783.1 Uncharacterised protein [Mycobacteroides abscessus subsp. abscessus]SKR79776.1 Uncharacterised protein [Mycobacteroides abscessus subsp. abscessus]SKR84375.1 Uncharacterised protein [Mycobacteroides abscessus subsp. abscessus]SKT25525.1 Uncharacterised protein [Mycobacteroides abscessus subsp. abscessus]